MSQTSHYTTHNPGGMLDCQVALLLLVLFTKVFMVVRDVEVGIRPATLLNINVVENIVPTRVPSI